MYEVRTGTGRVHTSRTAVQRTNEHLLISAEQTADKKLDKKRYTGTGIIIDIADSTILLISKAVHSTYSKQ